MPATTPVIAFLDVGGPEIMVILLVALLLFGSQRLPEFARNLGKSIREFKKATSGLEAELRRAMETPSPPPKPPAPAMPAASNEAAGGFDPDVPDDAESAGPSDTTVEDLKPGTPAGEEPDTAKRSDAAPSPGDDEFPPDKAPAPHGDVDAVAPHHESRGGPGAGRPLDHPPAAGS